MTRSKRKSEMAQKADADSPHRKNHRSYSVCSPVYSELMPRGTLQMVEQASLDMCDKTVMDLGSGNPTIVKEMARLYPEIRKAIGVELLKDNKEGASVW